MSSNIGQTSNFSPNQISGCQLWLDAADPTSITTSGTTVTGVTDKSGTNKVITVTNTVSYLRNQSLIFTSVNGLLSVAGMPSSPYDILTVVTPNPSIATYRTLLRTAGVPGTHPFLLEIANNNLGMWDSTAFRQFGSLTLNPNEKALAYATMASGRTMQASKNGQETLTVATPAGNESIITTIGNNGGGSQAWGNLQELLIFNRTLSLPNRQILEGYLAWKWGLNRSLPTTHPYYNTAVYSLNMPNVVFPLYSYPTPLFQPTFFSNCTLWLDSADRSSLTMNDNLVVTQWRDKSGLGNHGSNVGTIRNSGFIGGRPAMVYPGLGSTYFIGPLVNNGSNMSAFAVFTMNSSSYNSARILSLARIGSTDFGNALYAAAISRSGASYMSFRAGQSRGTVTATFGTPVINTTVFTGASNTYYQNGTAGTTAASSGNFGYSNYEVGGSFGEESLVPLNGSIGEVIHYNATLTRTQQQQVEGYLATKWGLQGSLDAAHPYKTNAFGALPPFPEVPVLPKYATNGRLSPRSFGSLQIWLDANDQTSLSVSGVSVTQWRDKSGNANNSTTVIGTPILNQKAINGFSAIRVQTGSYFYFSPLATSANTTTVSAFVVANLSNSPANTFGRLLSFGNTADGTNNFDFQTVGNFIFCRENVNQQMAIYRNSLAGPNVTMNVTYEQPFLMNAVFDGTNCSSFLNGTANTSFSSAGTFTFNQLGIGVNINTKSSPADVHSGLVGEVIVYYSALSTNQRQQIEGYLAWKWGLVGNLPSTHPFKLFPPPP
jgi:hypothetical protein